ncbi:GAF domain-containing protein [Corallococcus sp. M34]|uniref:GAF domain-containing protein n=1 Tax=Citreicoccus inhibens TaxID=2849499 RepID=UPI001C23FB92|nr:GAF domain-containing protein [Citreicoccus inhibens]MBU8894147.1 GAF domain-containing protein [Citreicoccus inhibens]
MDEESQALPNERERMLHRQAVLLEQSILLELAAARTSDFEASLRQILQSDAELLGVDRVSYWTFEQDSRALLCRLLYVRGQGASEPGIRLLASEYPHYFEALAQAPFIASSDAQVDPRTREFSASYLRPLGIRAMMDVPVWVQGRLGGVVCHEHQGTQRIWTLEEQSLARSIGHLVSMALESTERHRAEDSLRQSEEHFRLLVDGVKDYALVMLDPDGQVVSWNAGAERITGYGAQEALTKHYTDFQTKESVERGWPQLQLLGASEAGRVEVEGWRVRKDGSRFWANVVLTSLRAPDGRLRGFAEVSRDLTEQKWAEHQRGLLVEASASEQRQRLLSEVSSALVSSLDVSAALAALAHRVVPLLADACILHLEHEGGLKLAACEQGFGAMEVDVCRLLSGPTPALEPPPALLQVLRTGKARRIRHLGRLMHRLGPRIARPGSTLASLEPFSVMMAPLLARGRVLGTLTLLRNAPAYPYSRAELLLAEELARRSAYAVDNGRLYEELRRAEQSQRLLDEASKTLAESLDYETTLSRVAHLGIPQMADWCVVDVLEESGTPRRIALAHADPSKLAMLQELQDRYPARRDSHPPAARVLRTGVSEIFPTITDERLKAVASDAHHEHLLRELGTRTAIAVPLRARGRILGAITFASGAGRVYGPADLQLAEQLAHRTSMAIDNARLYQRARVAIDSRDEFLSIASHELRTPVTTLHLQLQTIQRMGRARQDLELTRRVDVAVKQMHRLDKLIDGLLDVSRITAGKLHFDLEPLDLSELAAEVVEQFQVEAHRAGCELRLHADEPVTGLYDRLRLEQVLANLLSNAFKYARGKPVQVTVRSAPGDLALLTVEDQGIGISEADATRIFSRFERAVSPRHYGGLGLGLFITQSIVQAHGGTIHVTSRPGEGSRFTVCLPRRPETARALDGAVSSAQEASPP